MPLNWATKIVSDPNSRMVSRKDSSNPRMIAVMPTIEVMPISIPRIVKAERTFCVRIVSNAITTIS